MSTPPPAALPVAVYTLLLAFTPLSSKVYYCPLVPIVDGDCMPTFCAFFPLFRQILIRERISLVHGHQASSVMSHEAILFAKTMGYRVTYTDHSLFGFADAARCEFDCVCCSLLFCMSYRGFPPWQTDIYIYICSIPVLMKGWCHFFLFYVGRRIVVSECIYVSMYV